MRTFELIIPGKPVGKQRPRMFNPKHKATGKPVMKYGQPVMIPMTPKETRNFEALIKQVAWDAKVPMLERCKLTVIICLPVRVKKFKTKPDEILEPGVRPDADNVFKACADALEGIVFRNDKHILEGKHFYRFITKGNQPFTKIIIQAVEWREYISFDE